MKLKSISIVILFIPFGIFSLSAQIVPKPFEYFQKGDYRASINEFNKTIGETVKVWGSTDTVFVLQSYMLMGACYEELNKIDSAVIYQEKANEIYLNHVKATNDDYNFNMEEYVANLLRIKQYEKALITIERFCEIKDLSKIEAAFRIFLIQTLNEIKSLTKNEEMYLSTENLIKIIKNTNWGLQNENEKCSAEVRTLIKKLNDSGIILYNQNNYAQATVNFVTVREMIDLCFGNQSTEYDLCLNNLANIYYRSKDSINELIILDEKFNLLKGKNQEIDTSNLWLADRIALLNFNSKNYKEAIKYYDIVLQQTEWGYGKLNLNYPIILGTLGQCYYALGDYDKSLEYFNQAREIVFSVGGKNHHDYGMFTSYISQCYKQLGLIDKTNQQLTRSFEFFKDGKFSEAIVEFEKDLPGIIKMYGDKDTTLLIQVYGLLAHSYSEINQVSKSLLNYELAIDIGAYYVDFVNDTHFFNVINYLDFLIKNNLILEKQDKLNEIVLKDWNKIEIKKRLDLLSLLENIITNYPIRNKTKLDRYIKESFTYNQNIIDEYVRLDSMYKFQFYDEKRYDKAILTANKLTYISKSHFGINSINYFIDNQSLASCYYEIKDFERCKQILLKIIENINSCVDCKKEMYISSLILLAMVCDEEKNYNEVIKYDNLIISLLDNDSSTYHLDKYYALNRIGKAYSSKYSYYEAEKYYLEAIEYSKQFLEYKNMHISTTALAINYLRRNEYQKAYLAFMKSKDFYEHEDNLDINEYCTIISYFNKLYNNMNRSLEGRKIIENIYKKYDFDVNFNQNILEACAIELGEFYTEEEDFINATKYYELALKYSVDTLSINYINAIINLGMSYEKISDYKKAEVYLTKGQELVMYNKDANPNDLATAHNNLSVLYIELNQYNKAEYHLKESLRITNEFIGNNNSDYGARLNNLAELFTKLNNFEQAKEYYLKSIKNAVEFLGDESLEYMIRTMNYAISLQNLGQIDSAMVLFKELLYLSEKNGYKYPKTDMLIFSNAATLLVEIGLFESALKHFLRIEKYYLDNSLQNTKEYATLLNNISFCYLKMSSKKEALEYAKRSLDITNNLFGQTSIESILSLSGLSKIYFRFSDFDQALITIDKALNTYKYNNSEKDLGAEINVLTDYASINLYFNKFSVVTEVIDSIIIKLNTFEELNLKYQNEKESEALIAYISRSYDLIRNILYKLSLNNVVSSEMHMYNIELTQKKVIISTLLNRRLAGRINATSSKMNFSMLKKTLKPTQKLIEFSSFRYLHSNSWTDSTIYVALFFSANDSFPKLITLCEQKQLDSIFVRNSERESTLVNNIYKNNRLYELIWKPIEPYVNKGDQIYFSPSGLLHQISIDAIAENDSTYLGDHYNFNQVGNTGLLSFENMTIKPVRDIAIFGGMNYEAEDQDISMSIANIKKDVDYVSRGLYIQDSIRSGKWSYLPGTKKEAENIYNISKDANITSKLYMGTDALEEQYKNLDGDKSPSILHIATHGFFFPDPKISKEKLDRLAFHTDNPFTIADNPMNRSGLLFSGSNKAWVGDSISLDREDGILTAYEASHTYLKNTELVVLSACETGLGDIKGSEGVYGLQRAFKMAGARYLMMSLWKVPDNATQEFMTTFYTELLTHKKSIRDAYNTTQKQMRDKYREEPYKWAGFVLME